MATKYVLDAHTVIWYLEGNARLGANAKTVLDDSKIGVSAISPDNTRELRIRSLAA